MTEFLKVFGVAEKPGPGDNPTIMHWAETIGLDKSYGADSVPWCGLAMAYVAAQAGWDHSPRGNALWALNWASWGVATAPPMLGDVLVFVRSGGGHVGVYVAEDETSYHVLGGNQDDQVTIKRIERKRLIASRRCPWRVNQPSNVRRIKLISNEPISINEA